MELLVTQHEMQTPQTNEATTSANLRARLAGARQRLQPRAVVYGKSMVSFDHGNQRRDSAEAFAMNAYDRYVPELDPANQERAYMCLKANGSGCIMEPHEAAALMAESPGEYTAHTVRMSQAQFEKLSDFGGF